MGAELHSAPRSGQHRSKSVKGLGLSSMLLNTAFSYATAITERLVQWWGFVDWSQEVSWAFWTK